MSFAPLGKLCGEYYFYAAECHVCHRPVHAAFPPYYPHHPRHHRLFFLSPC